MASPRISAKIDEDELEEIPLVSKLENDESVSPQSSDSPSNNATTEERVGNCRICLEQAPVTELEEPCECKGGLQRVHHACLQRWIDERDQSHNAPLSCEICKKPYKEDLGYTRPPNRPPPSHITERIRVGTDIYVIVIDPQTGMATARLSNADGDELFASEEENFEPSDRLNPISACAISFFLFMMCSLLLSHLFSSLPGSNPSSDMSPVVPVDEETADAEFQDVSATLLLLWLMLRLLVLIAPVYTISRFIERARSMRAERRAGSAAGVELRERPPSVVFQVHQNRTNEQV